MVMMMLSMMMLLACPGLESADRSPRIKFPVYIESTDAFGVAFYATYPVLLERSINQLSGRTGGRLRYVKQMRFRSAARLGDAMLFESSDRGTLRLINEATKEECFSAKGVQLVEDVMIAHRTADMLPSHRIHVSTHTLFHDEYHPSKDGLVLQLHTRTVFNLLERGRTDFLGGPGQLSRAAASSGHVYVARISDFERISDIPEEVSPSSYPEVTVLSQSVMLGDSMADFVQQLVYGAEQNGSHGRLLARARVTCCSVDPATGRPAPFNEDMRGIFVS